MSATPWLDEPNEETFEHAGLECRILRAGTLGHLCGYVRVPEGHPLHGLGYSDPVPASLKPAADRCLSGSIGKRGVISLFTLDPSAPRVDLLLDVHGSVTFSGELRGYPGTHWFGFDCAHAGDIRPRDGFGFEPDAEYRDIEYVRAECRSLADQLVALAQECVQ